MEGLCALIYDQANGRIWTGQDDISRDAQRPKTAPLKVAVARDIAGRPITEVMRVAVDLDGEASGQASEVEIPRADRMLAPELEAARSCLQ